MYGTEFSWGHYGYFVSHFKTFSVCSEKAVQCYLAQSTKDALLRSQKVNYKQAKSSFKHGGSFFFPTITFFSKVLLFTQQCLTRKVSDVLFFQIGARPVRGDTDRASYMYIYPSIDRSIYLFIYGKIRVLAVRSCTIYETFV